MEDEAHIDALQRMRAQLHDVVAQQQRRRADIPSAAEAPTPPQPAPAAPQVTSLDAERVQRALHARGDVEAWAHALAAWTHAQQWCAHDATRPSASTMHVCAYAGVAPPSEAPRAVAGVLQRSSVKRVARAAALAWVRAHREHVAARAVPHAGREAAGTRENVGKPPPPAYMAVDVCDAGEAWAVARDVESRGGPRAGVDASGAPPALRAVHDAVRAVAAVSTLLRGGAGAQGGGVVASLLRGDTWLGALLRREHKVWAWVQQHFVALTELVRTVRAWLRGGAAGAGGAVGTDQLITTAVWHVVRDTIHGASAAAHSSPLGRWVHQLRAVWSEHAALWTKLGVPLSLCASVLVYLWVRTLGTHATPFGDVRVLHQQNASMYGQHYHHQPYRSRRRR